MEGSCVQACQPFARPASGCRRAGQVPSTVKGSTSTNVGTRDGVDPVSSPKGHQVALKRRENMVLHSSLGWNEEMNWVITELTTLCEFWLQVSPSSVNPGPGALIPAAHCVVFSGSSVVGRKR